MVLGKSIEGLSSRVCGNAVHVSLVMAVLVKKVGSDMWRWLCKDRELISSQYKEISKKKRKKVEGECMIVADIRCRYAVWPRNMNAEVVMKKSRTSTSER